MFGLDAQQQLKQIDEALASGVYIRAKEGLTPPQGLEAMLQSLLKGMFDISLGRSKARLHESLTATV